jgi:hypothetical protein
MDGLRTISQLKYTIDDKSDNPTDNIFVVHNENIKVVNIKSFLTHIPFGTEEYYNYDLREPKRKIINPDRIKETKKSVISTTDWTNIPHYPTTMEKRENVVKYLMQMGRPVPPELLKKIQEDKIKAIEDDVFNKSSNVNEEDQESHDLPSENLIGYYKYHQQKQQQFQQPNMQNYNQIRQPIYQNYIQNGHISKIPVQMQRRPQPPPNKFSHQYAAYVGVKSRAQASARVGLGGVF